MTINREHLAGLNYALSTVPAWSDRAAWLRDLIAQAQAAPEAEPVAWANWKVGTKSYVPYRSIEEAEDCVRGSELAATQLGPYRVVALYASQQHDAELVELLWQVRKYVRIEDDDELLNRIDAKLATLSAKNEGGKV